jgi:hypothetical protein
MSPYSFLWLWMKGWMIQVLAVSLCLCACAEDGGSVYTSNSPSTDETKVDQGRCGDGICNGPENPRSCPADCEAKPTSEGSPEGVISPDADLPNEGMPFMSMSVAIIYLLQVLRWRRFNLRLRIT